MLSNLISIQTWIWLKESRPLIHLEKIEDVRELLVDHDVNGVDDQGDTPLIIAVKKGSYISSCNINIKHYSYLWKLTKLNKRI